MTLTKSLRCFILVCLALFALTESRTIKVINACGTTVWPGMFTGGDQKPDQVTGWELPPKQYTTFEVADDWTAGRIWARTGCTVQDGRFQCLTGSCGQGQSGDMTCRVTNEPPATLAEFTLETEGLDHYDISLVDGFNVPMVIRPSIAECEAPSCPTNINPMCPPLLRTGIDQAGKNLGCIAACNAGFGQEKWGNRACCSGGYNDPTLCAICGVDYYALFKDNCKTSYAYAYDEKSETALWTCPAEAGKLADYEIEFCPNRTDYVGTVKPGTEYLSATATCANMATAFGHTFSVGPSPTKTATQGTLKVVATVAPGVDGAAAIETTGDGQPSGGESSSSAQPSGTDGQGLQSGVYNEPTGIVGEDGRVTEIFKVIDGTTILEIHDPQATSETPTKSTGAHSKGGSWLQGVVSNQRKRKRSRALRFCWRR